MAEKDGVPVDPKDGEDTDEDLAKWKEDVKKQLDGVESLLGSFKKEQGDFRNDYKSISEQIAELSERLNNTGSSDDDFGEYVTSKDLEKDLETRERKLVQQIIGALGIASQQSTLMTDYKLDDEGLKSVKEYAEQHGIQDLEAAYLKMHKDKFGTQDKGELTKQILKELKEKGDFSFPGPGDGTNEPSDDPAKWLMNGETERFAKWMNDNPQSYEAWLAKREQR
jgi:hypothetical protein